MRNAARLGDLALVLVLMLFISISCSSDSGSSGNSSNKSYTIEGTVTPSEAGTVTPENGEYEEGEQVEISAEANDLWIFSSWEGDLTGTENPTMVTVDRNMTFTALFEKLQYSLNVMVEGGGTVEENIIQSKITDYEIGTEVELNAVADEGWVFVEWQGDLSGNENPQTIAMDEAKTVTAIFEKVEYKVNISTEGVGDVSLEPKKEFYTSGEEIEIVANPAESWAFSNWEGDLSGDENPKKITITSDISVKAVFGTIPTVKTKDVQDMRVTSVTGGGIVEDDGGFEVTERGVCWGEEEDPDFSDNCSQDGDGNGEFISDITGLRQGYNIYVRGYATNKAGTSFGKNEEFQAGYISHNYVDGLTPSTDSEFQSRTYKLVESNWKNGVGKIWIETNLGATGPVKDATDDDEDRAGWYFKFDRSQGYYHDGSNRTPNTGWSTPIGDFDWRVSTDPCQAAFGTDSDNWRVPTQVEWQGYIDAPPSSGGPSRGDYDAAYNSDLQLHAAGGLEEGDIVERGSVGLFWSRTSESSGNGFILVIDADKSEIDIASYGTGATIRCVKD